MKENRLTYLQENPEDLSDTVSQNERKETDEISVTEAKEYAEAAADIAVSMESGDYPEAAKTFYEAFLQSPGKMKRYRNFMMMTVNPIGWFTRNVPVLGLAAKLQIQIADKAIDKLFSIMGKVRDVAEDSEAVQLLVQVKGKWDELNADQQKAVKAMLSECVK